MFRFTFTLVFALVVVSANGAFAQDQTGPLIGSWEYRKVSLHVEFKNQPEQSEGLNGAQPQHAVITRSDWSPHRVGKKLYQNVVNIGKKQWSAEEIDDSGNVRKVRLRLRSDGKLHTTSYLDGRKKIQWTSNES